MHNLEVSSPGSIPRKDADLELRNTVNRRNMKKSSLLLELSPFLNKNGILRVGGCIHEVELPFKVMHPIIFPTRYIITNLIIDHFHHVLHHARCNSALNEVRSNGFCVINGNSLVRFVISKCVTCRILRGKTSVQQMADFPKRRLEPSPPFTYCCLDTFGPFTIRDWRSDLKSYVIIFTCLIRQAVHFECLSSIDTDLFFLHPRRFIGHKGAAPTIRSDNSSIFIGAKSEFQKAVQEIDTSKISNYLFNLDTDFISWKYNLPYASNFGGVWERLIRSARAMLDSEMMTHSHSWNDEALRMLLDKVEVIMNSRPLAKDGLNDPDSLRYIPLSPINLLAM